MRTMFHRGDLVAVGSVLGAAILTLGAALLLNGRAPMLFFLVAVTLSAARHGLRSGVVATVFSVLVIFLLFGSTISVVMAQHSELAVFVIVALASTFFVDHLHRANTALVRAQQELEEVNRKLMDHTESLAVANARFSQQQEALSLAHEKLRQVAEIAALDMQAPLKAIAGCASLQNCSSADDRLAGHAASITTEVLRLEALIAHLHQHAATATLPSLSSRDPLAEGR